MAAFNQPNHPAYDNCRQGWVRAGDIKFDREAYQRDSKERWVAELAETFDPRKAGTVELADNGDDTFDCIEGQHRVMAAERCYGPDFLLPALIWTDLSVEDRAESFGSQNNRKKLTGPEVYRAALTSGRDHSVIGVQQVLDERELHVSDKSHRDNIRGAKGLVTAYDQFGPEALGRALDVMEAAFGRSSETWISAVIQGFAQFFSQYPHAKDKRLVEQIRRSDRIACSRDFLNVSIADLNSGGGGGSRPRRVARTAQRLYDKGLASGRGKLVEGEL